MRSGLLAMPSNLLTQKLTRFEHLSLEIQRVVSRLLFILFGSLMSYLVFKRFKIRHPDLRRVRAEYRELLKCGEGPVIICSNHLTYVDSVIHSVFLGSTWDHIKNFHALPWHLPEKTHFYTNPISRALCYLGKSIPVLRSGTPAQSKRTMERIDHVLRRGDVISIFPEGMRSRSGRIDTENFAYASGQMLKTYPVSRAICIYLRSREGDGFTKFPAKDREYYIKLELLHLQSEHTGMRKAKDLSTQIIHKLKQMEDHFFEHEINCRQ